MIDQLLLAVILFSSLCTSDTCDNTCSDILDNFLTPAGKQISTIHVHSSVYNTSAQKYILLLQAMLGFAVACIVHRLAK